MHDIFSLLAQSAPAAGSSHKTLLQYIHAGGVIGYFIIVLSVVALALAIIAFVQLRIDRLAPRDVVEGLRRLINENNPARAVEFCQREENACFLARLWGAALARCQRSPFGMLEIRAALEEAGQREVDRLYRAVDGLALIAAVGPMLGLLGTVVGMIGAFATIGELESAAKSQELSRFMSIALVCTAQGLFVAIPCTVGHTLFRRRIDGLVGDVGEITELLVAELESADARPAARPQAKAPAAPAAQGAAPARA